MRLGQAILAAVWLSSCAVDVNFGNGPYLCAEAPFSCPDGMTCDQSQGRCVGSTSVDSGPSADGPIGGDAGGMLVVPEFSTPSVIAELEDLTSNDDDPTLTADLLYMVFASDRGSNTGPNFWTSSRASVADAWSTPVLDAELSSTFSETTTAISPDGLTFMFGRNAVPGDLGSNDIYISTRATRSDPWGAPEHVESLSTPASDTATWMSNGGERVVIATNVNGDYDLIEAVRNPDATYSIVGPVPGINTSADELSGRYSHGGLVFTFHADRPDSVGSTDGYSATRADLESPFTSIRPITAMNSANLDEDVFLSDDLCTLICVTRNGGDQDIFQATSCP